MKTSTVGRDRVPHEWRGRLPATSFAAGRMAGAESRLSRWSPACRWRARCWLAPRLVAAHRVVYAPPYFGGLADRPASAPRLVGGDSRRCDAPVPMPIGADIDDDAFSARRSRWSGARRRGYVMRLAPGITGQLEGGRAPIPLESVIGEGDRRRAAARRRARRGAHRHGDLRGSQRSGSGPAPGAAGRRRVERFARKALLPLELAALGSILLRRPGRAVRSARPRCGRRFRPRRRRCEIEKMLRQEAQSRRPRSTVLRRAADHLPEAGLRRREAVAVARRARFGITDRGVDVRRGLPGQAVPVGGGRDLVLRAAAESMRVVLPVQVLRTDKPLPYGTRARPRTSSARRRATRSRDSIEARRQGCRQAGRQPGGTSTRDRAARRPPRVSPAASRCR